MQSRPGKIRKGNVVYIQKCRENILFEIIYYLRGVPSAYKKWG